MRNPILICIVGITLASAAQADSCHPAFDQALEKAKATGHPEIVKEVEMLPRMTVARYKETATCEVVLPGDLEGVPDMYEPKDHAALWPMQLQRNEAALAVALDPSERNAFEDKVRKIDFAGVHIGENMQQVFETLRRQLYVSKARGHQKYKGLYPYDVECDDDGLRYNNGAFTSPPLYAKTCVVSTGSFEKTDEHGTHYEITVNFTELADIARAEALKNARVWSIEATVKMKEEVGQTYYEKLANDRYGSTREGRMPRRLNGALTFAGYHSSWDEDTMFKIEPYPDRLEILAQDQWLYDFAYEDAVEKLLASQKQAAHDAPKPKF